MEPENNKDWIDLRSVKCGCQDNPNCKIGVSFDADPNVMRMHDKYGKEHHLQLNDSVIDQLVCELNGYRSAPAEYILCAAILFDDGKKYLYGPKNVESGLVLCGHRHGVIFQQIGGLVGERQQLGIYEKEQGFLTNLNRFVDRTEAFKIAKLSHQLNDRERGNSEYLYSEDLY